MSGEPQFTFQCLDGKDVVVPQRLFIARDPEKGQPLPHSSSYLCDMLGDSPQENECVPLSKATSTVVKFAVKFQELYEREPLKPIQFPLERNCAFFMDFIGPIYREFAQSILDHDKVLGYYSLLLDSAYFSEHMDLRIYKIFLKGLFISLVKNKTREEINENFKSSVNVRIPGVDDDSSDPPNIVAT